MSKLDRILNGYILTWAPTSPMSIQSGGNKGYCYLHRIVMSAAIGRQLRPRELVHHLDGNRSNNNLDNLSLTDRREHARIHHGAEPRYCSACGAPIKSSLVAYCSRRCAGMGVRKVNRPDRKALLLDVASMSMLAVGRKYGVSDNAVRKWLRAYSA